MKRELPEVYSAIVVAKKLTDLAAGKREVLTPMQLLKLVYLCHAWMLALYRRPLIQERVEAWKYGPVIPELYRAIKQFKSHPVTEINCSEVTFDEDSSDIIQQVYEKYGHFNGIQLSMLTHEEGSPWDRAWKNGSTGISNDLITHYYQELVEDV